MSDVKLKVCGECGGKMVAGVSVTVATGFGVPVQWVAGEPHKPGFWSNGVPTGEKHLVATYRCEKCGLLKSYAQRSE